MTTIRQVAKDANVSIATVSRVLNSHPTVSVEVKSRVLKAINRSGYMPNVGRRVTSFVALAYTGPASLGSPYDAALMEGLATAMDEGELDLVVLNFQRDKKPTETYTQFFVRKGVRGVILRTTNRTRSVCEAIAEEGFPTIVVGDRFERPDMNFVYYDSRDTSQQGVEHLIGLGHRRIALAISDLVEDNDHADRLAGHQQALKEHDIPFEPKLIFHIPPARPDGAQVIRSIMSMSNPPSAVYVTDPMVAIGAINEAHNLGVKIPSDLSVLGFDDTDQRNNVYPQMTAVCQDAKRLGYEAFTALSKSISADTSEKRIEPTREALPTWLEINGTTGRPAPSPIQILPEGTRA